MSAPTAIKTPRGEVVTITLKNGAVKAKLVWDPAFPKRMNTGFTAAQKMLDSAILKGCSSRVPFMTGMLQKSGILGTVVGSGKIEWITPYASDVYYRHYTGSNGDPNRGGYWFERWKTAEGEAVIQKVKETVGNAV